MMQFQSSPPPRFITPRDPAAATEGRQIARLSRALGKPLMPWQRMVVDGATEKTANGFYKYPVVVVTVPRQSGKTTLVGPVQIHRIMTRPKISAFFTAQTGKDATDRMRDIITMATGSPLKPLFKPRYAAGSMGLSLANGSRLTTFAGPDNIHGETPHLVTMDEIWRHDQAKGIDFMGAIGPAQATLEGESQIWFISTMGTSNSGMLNDLVERGRSQWPGMFYAEWSMADGLDPYEPQTWWTFHPALGNTITESYLAKESNDQPHGEWMRAYMNRLTSSSDPLVAEEDWQDLNRKPLAVPSKRDLAITYEVAYGGESAAVMATWRDTDGVACTRVLHAAPGTAWLIPFIVWIITDWKPAVVAADDGGETRRVTDELRRLGHEISTIGYGDFATACVGLLTYIREKQLRQDGSRTLAAAIAHVVLQPMSDGWRFSRKNSTGPIAALNAAAVGLWAYDHREPELAKPIIHF
nr:terminase family protein [Microterricola gilva]